MRSGRIMSDLVSAFLRESKEPNRQCWMTGNLERTSALYILMSPVNTWGRDVEEGVEGKSPLASWAPHWYSTVGCCVHGTDPSSPRVWRPSRRRTENGKRKINTTNKILAFTWFSFAIMLAISGSGIALGFSLALSPIWAAPQIKATN